MTFGDGSAASKRNCSRCNVPGLVVWCCLALMRTKLDKLTESKSKVGGQSLTLVILGSYFFLFRLLFPFGTLGKKMVGNRYLTTQLGH